MKVTFRKIVTVDDPQGNAVGFGPGEVDLPDWAAKSLSQNAARWKRLTGQDVPLQPKQAVPAIVPDKANNEGVKANG